MVPTACTLLIACLQHPSSDVTDAARRAYIIHYGRLERKGSSVTYIVERRSVNTAWGCSKMHWGHGWLWLLGEQPHSTSIPCSQASFKMGEASPHKCVHSRHFLYPWVTNFCFSTCSNGGHVCSVGGKPTIVWQQLLYDCSHDQCLQRGPDTTMHCANHVSTGWHVICLAVEQTLCWFLSGTSASHRQCNTEEEQFHLHTAECSL